MHDRDVGKCLKQLRHCYCLNRRLADPLQFHVNGLAGRSEAEMQARHSGYINWDVHFHKESYVQVTMITSLLVCYLWSLESVI
jgi:hypothetical protein